MESQYTFLIVLVAMVGLMFFTQRSQKKQAQKRMESLKQTAKKAMKLLQSVDFTEQSMK